MPFRTQFLPFAGLLCGLACLPSQAQVSAPWQVTRLDSVASVRMPYAGTFDDELLSSGVAVFATSTSDNDFDALVFTPPPAPARALKPGQVWVPDVDRFLTELMRLPDKSFAKARLKTSYPITLPSAPGGKAMHQVYSGFDDYHQIPAALELTWVVVGQKLYVFRCSYSMPQEPGAAEDARHFFTTIEFNPIKP
ncbi:hypothetical protein ACFP2F_17895 [Hymenobacter artigasi]|uniref:DUF1795 domain-containing protein n=1 Tax=Hymenobacter artigasi TaxID=2719616 RepID=A0ABX1HM43_9BACT|nr:hypothetical protein [Hymenobacter artigasi]NKI91185.1 hypothetical protein [Hymenobacter artigasi]